MFVQEYYMIRSYNLDEIHSCHFQDDSSKVILLRQTLFCDLRPQSACRFGCITLQTPGHLLLGQRPVNTVTHKHHLIPRTEKYWLRVPLHLSRKTSPDKAGQIFTTGILIRLLQGHISLQGEQGQVVGKVMVPIELDKSATAPQIDPTVPHAEPGEPISLNQPHHES